MVVNAAAINSVSVKWKRGWQSYANNRCVFSRAGAQQCADITLITHDGATRLAKGPWYTMCVQRRVRSALFTNPVFLLTRKGSPEGPL